MGLSLKNILRSLVVPRLKRRGYYSFGANSVFNKVFDDLFNENSIPLAKKIWAHRHGFVAASVVQYGITDQNYTDYLPDFTYEWLHPINGAYSRWIDDKLILRSLLAPYARFLPEYYYHLCRGEVLPLEDCPPAFGRTPADILRLLQTRGALAVKLKAGTFGQGFTKLGFESRGFSINNDPCPQEHITAFLGRLLSTPRVEYLITEYIHGHADLRKIFPDAPGAVRIVTARPANQPPRILFADILIPTRKAGLTTNLTRYSVGCLIDFDTGRMYNGDMLQDGRLVPCTHHPDTNVPLEGNLPNWPLVREKILEICTYIPQVRYMGFDLIVTDDGFKIIEINSHPGNSYMQSYFPVLKAEPSRSFFLQLLEEKRAILDQK